ncbi:COG4315 family predicted lipoprotein [Natrinema halophilum]|uniref:Lipoprotein with Yx(FWY)xxD motif n=1 Tax=Natrinema halophilum TaxID=1699371 RepID=A0A7D5KZY7_9EURY|nr:hypothetical protein [Natrinema halophilum]QLG50420.1 hypothetical protein HYG82_16985 [Natrinema halophilum]
MRIPRRTLLTGVATSAAIAGCLGGGDSDEPADDAGNETDDSGNETDDSGNETDDSGNETDDSEADATVRIRSHSEHGDVLVGPDGLTLYNFDRDTQDAAESACSGDCVDAWPPLTVDQEPTAGEGVTAELTTFERADGTMQVAANGWPLYYFASDEEPGDANGHGANDVWWVLGPDGTPMRPSDGNDPDNETESSS